MMRMDMSGRISVFYENVFAAARESGKTSEEALIEAKTHGVSAVDMDYSTYIARKTPLTMPVNSIYAFFDFSEACAAERAKSVIDAAKKENAVAMFVADGLKKEDAESLKKLTREEEIFGFLDALPFAVKTAEALEKLASCGKERGVPVCVENFDSRTSLTERRAELAWLFRRAPHLGFNADTGNSVTCGEDIRVLCREFSGRIVNVHCKDRAAEEKFPTAAVGEGVMPIREIRNSLLAAGYTGRFSVEVFGVNDTIGAIGRSAEYLSSL